MVIRQALAHAEALTGLSSGLSFQSRFALAVQWARHAKVGFAGLILAIGALLGLTGSVVEAAPAKPVVISAKKNGAARGTTSQPQPTHPGNKPPLLGKVQKVDPSKVKITIPPGQLQVQTGTGEFESYNSQMIITEARKVTFRWIPKVQGITSAKWQVSEQAFPADGSTPPLKAQGNLPAGTVGHQQFFTVDFKTFAAATPAQQPRAYYIRVVTTGSPAVNNKSSQVCKVTYQRPGPGTTFTTKGLMPELWNPMRVEVDLGTLRLVKADESEEEPYLITFVFWVDGTTINPLNFAGSSVRSNVSAGVHDNVPQPEDFTTGQSVAIPDSVGRFERTILPIGLDVVDFPGVGPDLLIDNTKVYVVVMALEEDATSDSAAQAAKSALVSALRAEVDNAVKTMTVGSKPNLDIAAIQGKVQQKALDAAKADTLSGVWNPIGAMLALDDLVDPDDFIGAGVQSFSYRQIRDAGPGGISISMDLSNDSGDHYRVSGHIKRKQ